MIDLMHALMHTIELVAILVILKKLTKEKK